ncbi:MAG: hypothetical protein AAGC55_03490 [Myxococcota bacterium]
MEQLKPSQPTPDVPPVLEPIQPGHAGAAGRGASGQPTTPWYPPQQLSSLGRSMLETLGVVLIVALTVLLLSQCGPPGL